MCDVDEFVKQGCYQEESEAGRVLYVQASRGTEFTGMEVRLYKEMGLGPSLG